MLGQKSVGEVRLVPGWESPSLYFISEGDSEKALLPLDTDMMEEMNTAVCMGVREIQGTSVPREKQSWGCPAQWFSHLDLLFVVLNIGSGYVSTREGVPRALTHLCHEPSCSHWPFI